MGTIDANSCVATSFDGNMMQDENPRWSQSWGRATSAEFGINAVAATETMEESAKKPPPVSDHEDGSTSPWGLLGIRWDMMG